MSMTEQTAQKPKRKRLKRFGIWSIGFILVLTLAAAFTVLSLIGTRIAAPPWLHERVIKEINADLNGFSIDFGEMAFVLQDDWVPKVEMQNVVLRDTIDTPLAQLSNVSGTVALGPLLRGNVQPGQVRLSGARLLVRRARDGGFDLQVGTSGASESVASLADLVGQVDAVFERPQLASLSRVAVDNLTVQYDDARIGQSWTVDGGRISLLRSGEMLELSSDFALLGNRGFATTLDFGYRSTIGSPSAEFSMSFDDMPARDIAGQSPALSWLEALQAPISGALTVRVDEAGNLGPLAAQIESSGGALLPNEASRPIAFDGASAAFTYSPETHQIRFQSVELDSKWVSAKAEGQTRLEGMEDGWPDALVSQYRVTGLRANPLQAYDTPLELDGALLDMRLTLDPFEVRFGELSLTDQGQTLRVSGTATADSDGWKVGVNAHLPSVDPDRVIELWPEVLKPKTRNWITSNIKSAELSNIQFALNAKEGAPPDVFLGLDFDKLESRFIKGVPHIKDGRGTMRIDGKQFVVTAHQGYVDAAQGGKIDITGSSFEIPDITIKRGPGVVRLKTEGTITAGLSLLNSGPFGYMDKAGQPVTLADGRARVGGRLDFLVVDNLKPEEVEIALAGTLHDVRSETLLKGRVLGASQLWVDATHERLRLGGKGRVGLVPFDGSFEMPFGKGTNGRASVDGSVEISERFIDEFRIGLPPGSVSGAGRGKIKIDFERGTPPKFRMNSDLAGLALRLPQLDWAVSEKAMGELSVSGQLGEPPKIDKIALNAGGLKTTGSVTLNPDGQLQLARFDRVQLDGWLDASVDLVGAGAGRPPLIRIRGGKVDMRKTSLGGSGSGGNSSQSQGGGPMSIKLDRLQISDGIALTDFDAELDMSKGADGPFTGKVNGQAPIKGRVLPKDGRSGFIVTSLNAGAVFRSAGLLKQARDGRMELFLFPGKKPGVYEGKLEANNLRIKDAPAMAALLNAISLVGILEQLSGEGIHFNTVEAQFQLAPDKVTVYSGSAVGASMGISMEGYYYPETSWLDMEGVISPIYAVNVLGQFFTRKGEGLLGFTYGVDGVATNPKVSVNPLSLLTPGMFRDIFRRAPPKQQGQVPQTESSSKPTSKPHRTKDQDR